MIVGHVQDMQSNATHMTKKECSTVNSIYKRAPDLDERDLDIRERALARLSRRAFGMSHKTYECQIS